MEKSKFGTVVVPAQSNLRSMLSMIEQGGTRSQQGQRVLIDLSEVASPPGEVESVLLGHHAGQHLSSFDRVAVLRGRPSGQGEVAARRMGANLRVFTERHEAVAWLNDSNE